MTEEKPLTGSTSDEESYSSGSLNYLDPESETAMICEQDTVIREKISHELKKINFVVVEPATFKDAAKYMRYNIFDLVIVGEDFDAGVWEVNNVLNYITKIPMNIRRQTFVALLSSAINTFDNMWAYNKSVNLIINKKDLGDFSQILRRGMAENGEFYHVFKDIFQKSGRV